MTAYELIRGHAYRGRLCQYGEPAMCFVADTTKRKGDARWKQGIFLTKAVTNDMFLVHCEGNVRLTRSVKAIYKEWSEHMGLYRTLVVQPWHIDGTIGNRLDPAGVQGSMEGAPALHDEPGEDPPDVEAEDFVGVPVALTPNASLQSRMKPPPDTAAVAGPVTPILVPVESAKPTTTMTSEVAEEDVSMAAPALRGAPAAVTPFSEEGEEGEPTAKRQKLSTRRVGNEELVHMDVELHEHLNGHADDDIFYNWLGDNDEISGSDDDDFSGILQDETNSGLGAEAVWRPYSEMQPELDADELHLVDVEADKIEIRRLLSMGVITTTDQYVGELDVPLSAKMVRTWRQKMKSEAEGTMWMRISWP